MADPELVRMAHMPPPVIPEPQDDQKEDAEGDKNSKAKKSAKRKRFVPQALNSRIPLHQSAPYNVAKLTVDGLKLSFHHLPVDLFSNECAAELQNMLQDLTSIVKVWEGISQTMPEKLIAPFVEMVDSLRAIFQCGLAAERDRPSIEVVRLARGCIYDGVYLGPISECCKAFLSYAATRVAMESEQEHSAASLADDSASAAFMGALEVFEQKFKDTFDDLGSWIFTGNSDAPQTSTTVQHQYMAVEALLAHLSTWLDRWSPAGLESHLRSIGDLMQNIVQLIHIGVLVMLLDVRHKLFQPTAMAEPVGAPIGEVAPGDDDVDAAALLEQPTGPDAAAYYDVPASQTHQDQEAPESTPQTLESTA